MSNTESGDKQRERHDWICNHLLCCVSELVHELAQNEKYMDALMAVCVKDDWEEPSKDFIRGMDRTTIVEILEGGYSVQCYDHETDAVLRTTLFTTLKDEGELQEFCWEHNLDPHQSDAYEHWIVTDWFADRLLEKGEMVIKDFLGLTIWGRTRSGQAIFLDDVIEQIYTAETALIHFEEDDNEDD